MKNGFRRLTAIFMTALMLLAVVPVGALGAEQYSKSIIPAIDLAKSGTRHEELLLSPAECEGVAMVRRMLGQGHTREATAQLISMLLKTEKNEDFFKRLKEWLAIWEKEGYTIRSLRSGV